MTKTVYLGALLAAFFVVSLGITQVLAASVTPISANPSEDYFEVTAADASYSSFSMTVADNIPHLTKTTAPDLINFWAWVLPSDSDGLLKVAALTIHHGANDHLVTGDLDKRSSPVQGFHPHIVKFDENFCIADLQSPVMDFDVSGNQATLDAIGFEGVGVVATGTIDGSLCITEANLYSIDAED